MDGRTGTGVADPEDVGRDDSADRDGVTPDLLTPNESLGEIRTRLRALERRDAAMSALQETALDLAGSQDTDEVLRAIVRRARQLVRADLCYFSVLDPNDGAFCSRVAEGTSSSSFDALRMASNHGVLGHVTRHRAPYFTSDYMSDHAIVHDPKVDGAMTREGIVSLLGVPLLARGEMLGVFFVADRSSRVYRPEEIATLTALANHAALALANATLLDRTRAAHDLVERQQADVIAAASAHEKMTDLLAHGGSQEELVSLVAALFECPAYLIDPTGRDLPAGIDGAEIIRAMRESMRNGRSVSVEGRQDLRLAAITSSGDLLGGLLVECGNLEEPGVRTIERAAIVLSIMMLSKERLTMRGHSQINDALGALLSDPQFDEGRLRRQLKEQGINLESPQVLIFIDSLDVRRAVALNALRGAVGRTSLIGEHGANLAVLVGAADADAEALRLKERAENAQLVVNMAVGNAATGVRALRTVASACVQTLRLQKTLDERGTIAFTDRFGVYAMLFDQQRRPQLDAFVRAVIGGLIDRDRSTSSDLTSTLLAFIEHGHSVRVTADILKLHANTVRQRLETITTILGEWSTPSRIFEVHAALRLHTMREVG